MLPQLSIITINLNNKTGLVKTAESIAGQSFQPFEWIVIDGKSTDGSVEVMKEYSDAINIGLSEKDTGIYNAMNKGIKLATGKYCLFLNSGDTLLNKDSLNNLFQEKPNAEVVYFNRVTIENGQPFILKYPKKLWFSYLYNCALNHQSSIIERTAFEKYGYYREDFKISSDYVFFVTAICKYGCSYQYIDKEFTSFERGGLSTSQDVQGKKEHDIFMEEAFPLFVKDMEELNQLQLQHEGSLFKIADKIYQSSFFKNRRQKHIKKLKLGTYKF